MKAWLGVLASIIFCYGIFIVDFHILKTIQDYESSLSEQVQQKLGGNFTAESLEYRLSGYGENLTQSTATSFNIAGRLGSAYEIFGESFAYQDAESALKLTAPKMRATPEHVFFPKELAGTAPNLQFQTTNARLEKKNKKLQGSQIFTAKYYNMDIFAQNGFALTKDALILYKSQITGNLLESPR